VTAPSSLVEALERNAPPMGGFNLTILRLEVRRLLRNRRTMIFAMALPVIFFLGFGRNSAYVHQSAGRGNLTAFEMISIALFGAVFASATGGAMVSIERTLGWSRQLRVTPLSPTAYIVIKMLTSLTLAAGAVGAVYLVGAVTEATMPTDLWVITGVCVWIGSLLFSALGLFIGYLLPSENVTQIIALVLMLCCFAGGLFIPVSKFPHTYATLAKFTPLYGLNELVHYPLVISSDFEWVWVLNLAVWLAAFVLGAVWQFRRDTARV
jgi:ABC-2 type transport system permease protein